MLVSRMRQLLIFIAMTIRLAGTRRVLDIDAVTARLMAEIHSQDTLLSFSLLVLLLIIHQDRWNGTGDIQLFENGHFTIDMAYMPDGTLCRWCRWHVVYFQTTSRMLFILHIKMTLLLSYESTSATQQFQDPDHLTLPVICKNNLLFARWYFSVSLLLQLTHVYVEAAWDYSGNALRLHTPEKPQKCLEDPASWIPQTILRLHYKGRYGLFSVCCWFPLSFFLKLATEVTIWRAWRCSCLKSEEGARKRTKTQGCA